MVAAGHRSIHPNIPGVPSWAAVLLAITATAIGFALDAGSSNKQLTQIFAALYVTGCVAAVLAVRQSGVFTAVIQPPLILFFAVPGAYWLFHDAKIGGAKDLLINCGYPLIERFPLMLGTAAAVLLIGVLRWYFGATGHVAKAAEPEADSATTSGPRRLVAKLAAVVARYRADKATAQAAADSPQARAGDNRSASRRPAGTDRPVRRSTPERPRHYRRAPDDDPQAPLPHAQRRRSAPTRDLDAESSPQRRRRPRPMDEPELRGQLPRDARRDPPPRRDRYQRSETRSSRFEPYEPLEPYVPYDPYRPYEAYESPRSRGSAASPNSAHQPISRVRYRQSARYQD